LHERRVLARLYQRDEDRISRDNEDLLASTMEAAADESFDSIIHRIWATLNDGRSIDTFAEPRRLSWFVRAYLVVCFFHREYLPCPEALLREALNIAGTDIAAEDLAYQLDNMIMREGWHIFRNYGSGSWKWEGNRIGAAHSRIAREAWRLRPVQAFNIADWLIQASTRVEESCYTMGQLATMLSSSADERDRQLVERLSQEWTVAAEEGRVTTRALCSLNMGLAAGRGWAGPYLKSALTRQAQLYQDESWLAVLQLYHLSDENRRRRRLPENVDLVRIVDAADFSLAPARASELAALISDELSVSNALVRRLLDAFDGKLNWTIGDALLQWLVAHAPARELETRLAKITAWLDANETAVNVRASLLKLLADLNHPELQREMDKMLVWLGDGEGKEALGGIVLRLAAVSGSFVTACDVLEWSTRYLKRHRADRSASAIAVPMARVYRRVYRDARSGAYSSFRPLLWDAYQTMMDWPWWKTTAFGELKLFEP
jgi:hypothetical protein